MQPVSKFIYMFYVSKFIHMFYVYGKSMLEVDEHVRSRCGRVDLLTRGQRAVAAWLVEGSRGLDLLMGQALDDGSSVTTCHTRNALMGQAIQLAILVATPVTPYMTYMLARAHVRNAKHTYLHTNLQKTTRQGSSTPSQVVPRVGALPDSGYYLHASINTYLHTYLHT